MRIAVFTAAFPVISETFISEQVAEFLARGHDVTVFPLVPEGDAGALSSAVAEVGVLERVRHLRPAVRLPRWRRALRLAAAGARAPRRAIGLLPHYLRHRAVMHNAVLEEALLSREHLGTFDVLHCHYGPAGIRAMALRTAGRISGPIAVTFHGFDVNVLPRVHGTKVYRKLFSEAALLTANSSFLLGRLLALGAPPERTLRVPIGVAPERVPAFSRRFSPGALRCLSVGRLAEVKGTEYGLKAFAGFAESYPESRYTIIGDGPRRDELRQLAAGLGVSGAVDFAGAQNWDAVVAALGTHDLFLHPAVPAADGIEAQGRVLVEAQLAGLPVVASRVGGIPETVGEDAGLLVEPKDVAGLTDAMRDLAENPERRAQMSRAGRAFAAEHFDHAACVTRLLEAFAALGGGDDRADVHPR